VLIFISSVVKIFMYQHLVYNTLSNVVLVAGKIPPRNPMTRHSSRTPKLKEVDMGEGYSPGMVRKL
jgi:hypothetical protein